jgi:hypothetical protein
LLVFTDIVEVRNGLLQVHAIDCLGSFTGVFEVHTEIRATSLCGLCRVDRRCCVADHDGERWRSGDGVGDGGVALEMCVFGDVTAVTAALIECKLFRALPLDGG